MTRSPLFLAALASSAVPGLDPATVEGVRTRLGGLYEVAYLHDTQDRRWVIKAPLTPAAGAMLEDVVSLTTLLGRRLEVAVPIVRGQVVVPEGRAVVYPRIPGHPVDFRGLPGGPGLASDLGRTLAHIHNVELAVLDEAGRPSYDAETHRARQLSELDRAAATGHVPAGLLGRWERALEDVSHWRFAPTVVHGSFRGSHVLATFDDDENATSGRVRGVLAWEESRIGDPADDLAALVELAPAAALDTVLEAYAQSRVERPDPNLLVRARLAAEMSAVHRLLAALSAGALPLVDEAADRLRALDELTHAEEERAAEEARARLVREEAERSRQQGAAEGPGPAAREPDPAWDATQPHDTPVAAVKPTGIDSDLTQPHTVAAPAATEPSGIATTSESPPADSSGAPQTEDDRPDAPRTDDDGSGAGHVNDMDPAAQPDDRGPTSTDRAELGESNVTGPADDEGDVLDLHEGASDFVPVDPPPRPGPGA
ncbi:MAG: phosphotransferase [Micrococcales bacterium]|nr:phosphotransferase [Micrococcales bacterium]